METVTLPNGHIILPHEICRRLGLEAGVRLEADFDPKTGCIRLRPVNRIYVSGGWMKDRVRKQRRPDERKGK